MDTRWPTSGDRLFAQSTWVYDAPLAREPGERFYRMPRGYKRAGDLLIEQAAADVVDRSNVIYAALFCYRQSIELFLKKIITDFGDDAIASLKATHELDELWRRFIDVLGRYAMEDEAALEVVAKVVIEMNDADRRSDGFRFPTDRQNMPFAFGDRGIDLENIRDVMNGVANFFECVHLALAQQVEMESEARAAFLGY